MAIDISLEGVGDGSKHVSTRPYWLFNSARELDDADLCVPAAFFPLLLRRWPSGIGLRSRGHTGPSSDDMLWPSPGEPLQSSLSDNSSWCPHDLVTQIDVLRDLINQRVCFTKNNFSVT